MFTHVTRRLAGTRLRSARSIVVIALPIVLLAGASDAGAMSLIATHAPGGALHAAIAQLSSPQTETASRPVGLIDGAQR